MSTFLAAATHDAVYILRDPEPSPYEGGSPGYQALYKVVWPPNVHGEVSPRSGWFGPGFFPESNHTFTEVTVHEDKYHVRPA